MKEMRDYFDSFLNSIITQYSGKTLIFFKGFAISQLEQIIAHPDTVINNPALISNGCLDLNVLDDTWIDAVSTIRMANGPLVGFYEELLAISEVIARLKIDKIVVVENNILTPWTPNYYPYDYAVRLFDYWQEEKEPRDDIIEAERPGEESGGRVAVLRRLPASGHDQDEGGDRQHSETHETLLSHFHCPGPLPC